MLLNILTALTLTVVVVLALQHGLAYRAPGGLVLLFYFLVFCLLQWRSGRRKVETSHSWDILGQRFALDLVQADAAFRRHEGSGRRLEQYFCYGEAIVAAADGTVVRVEDGVADAPFVGWGFCDFTARHFAGSHVIIRHAEGEFGVYAHLIKGSVCVRPGDTVRQGDLVGRCGHSGHSTEPHLHFHLQDSPDFFRGMGLPIRFHDIVVNGVPAASARGRAAQRVRNATQSPNSVQPRAD